MASDDFYELLGVSRDATDDDIKRAYRRLARELHPDANPGDPAAEDQFKKITLAYETLRDAERRQRYDIFGVEGLRAAAAAGTDPFGFAGAGLGDLFNAFFGGSPFGGGRARAGGPRRGSDHEITLELTFEEAVFGAKREVSVRLAVECSTCGGSGARPGTRPIACRTCAGTGEIRRVRQSILGQMITATPCGRCGGTGEEVSTPCADCGGEGRRWEEKTWIVDIPPGVDNGSTLRLAGRGFAAQRGGMPGDLYVHLRVLSHDRFERRGYDLLAILHVPMTVAALGTHLVFDTLDGSEDLVIPPGTQTGKIFRLRGRGVPHVDARGRGDLLLQIVVDTPTNLSKADEQLLRDFAAERGEDVAPPDTGFLSRIRSAFK